MSTIYNQFDYSINKTTRIRCSELYSNVGITLLYATYSTLIFKIYDVIWCLRVAFIYWMQVVFITAQRNKLLITIIVTTK